MSFLTADAMRALDARTIEGGTSGLALMGRAARGVAVEFLDLCGGDPGRVLILCGSGNNGGDGFALAYLLSFHSSEVEVWVAAAEERVRGDARHYLRQLVDTRVSVSFLGEAADWDLDSAELPMVDWAVDCLLGTGSKGAPRDALAGAVDIVRRLSEEARVLAVDLPSGLNADTGVPYDESVCVRADITLTLGAAKAGFLEDASAEWTGSVTVVDLEFPSAELEAVSVEPVRVMDPVKARKTAPWRRPAQSHKGMFGHVLVIGGSPGMVGAPVLSGLAALRRGAGMVSVLVPRSCAPIAASMSPELMVYAGWEDEEGCLIDQEIEFSAYDAVVIGPGMRVTGETRELVDRVCMRCPVPAVLDADALRALSGRLGFLQDSRAPRVLTPHPGEMAGLLGVETAAVQADRRGALLRAVALSGSAVVLKGCHSWIAGPEGAVWLNLNGNPGLATAGSGDVLAGMLSAHLAGGRLSPTECAALACYEHGRIGDRVARVRGQAGLTASDLVEGLAGLG
ncbi:MAG: NAD(P)H-hydrate dehydratase [Verrucomicrobia bacterium]|nr:NAD(P)H-hydrate dehydratase [Verrucomicrobiota bacterium]MCH8527944.1 NAD(P)H-hydrate dehydratase [Kiritimatiellia bacterium]